MKRAQRIDVPDAGVRDAFHRCYYDFLGWDKNYYLGYQVKQCPFDLQVYQELAFKVRPRFIIQMGQDHLRQSEHSCGKIRVSLGMIRCGSEIYSRFISTAG